MKKLMILFVGIFGIIFSMQAQSWIGNSYIFIEQPDGSNVWYNAHGKYNQLIFHGTNLGTVTTLKIGGEAQTYPIVNNGVVVTLEYMIDGTSFKTLPMSWFKNENSNGWWHSTTTDVIAGLNLTPGTHTIDIWFHVTGPNNANAYDNNSNNGGKNYVATFTIADTTPPTIVTAEASNVTPYVADICVKATDDVAVTQISVLNGNDVLINKQPYAEVNGTSCYTISDLEANTEYTLTVEAYDAAGNKSTKPVMFKTLIVKPVIDETKVYVSVIRNSAEVTVPVIQGTYDIATIRFSLKGTESLKNVTDEDYNAGNIYTLSELAYNTDYFYDVTAIDSEGNESEPFPLEFKTGVNTGLSTPGIDQQPVKTQYFTVTGQETANPVSGLYLVKKTFADDSVKTEKLYVK